MDPSSYRQLLPAPSRPLLVVGGSSSSENSSTPSPPRSRPRAPPVAGPTPSRRLQIRVACENCRLKKAKCDGRRPLCGRCRIERLECQYDSDPGISRSETLRRRNAALQQRLDDGALLLDWLASRPNADVRAVLGKLRSIRQHEGPTAMANLVHSDSLLSRLAVNASLSHLAPDPARDLLLGTDSELCMPHL